MAALNAIYTETRKGRSISRSAIRQLHQVIAAHQPTYRAMNQFGQWFDATLHAGAFKTLPNNPTRPDGVIREYCPPIHVESELDNLLAWYADYCAQPDVYHPVLTAAWLHHRFAQIHPFADGNGRVTRALVAWHLVQHDYLPIVVTRDDRNDYFDALEAGRRRRPDAAGGVHVTAAPAFDTDGHDTTGEKRFPAKRSLTVHPPADPTDGWPLLRPY